MNRNKTLVFIPTYNELGNIKVLLDEILKLRLEADILFLDDNSPDGTGDLLDTLALKNENLFVIHREVKSGLGSAHKDGILWAIEHQYSKIITSDADFTFAVADIKKFIPYFDKFDLVVGSRFIHKESLNSWDFKNKARTYVAHWLIILLLRMKWDSTGSFRMYNLNTIPAELIQMVVSNDYDFFIESMFLIHKNGFRIQDFPVKLSCRADGESKRQMTDVWRNIKLLCSLSFKSIVLKKRLMLKDLS